MGIFPRVRAAKVRLMIAINFIEGMLFIGMPATFVIGVTFSIWVEKSDHPFAQKQRAYNSVQSESYDDDDEYGESPDERRERLRLQRSMQEFYDRENYRGRGGNV